MSSTVSERRGSWPLQANAALLFVQAVFIVVSAGAMGLAGVASDVDGSGLASRFAAAPLMLNATWGVLAATWDGAALLATSVAALVASIGFLWRTSRMLTLALAAQAFTLFECLDLYLTRRCGTAVPLMLFCVVMVLVLGSRRARSRADADDQPDSALEGSFGR